MLVAVQNPVKQRWFERLLISSRIDWDSAKHVQTLVSFGIVCDTNSSDLSCQILYEMRMPSWDQLTDDALRCLINSEAEMDEFGYQIARYLEAGDVVALIGDLGAGKTRFVKAVAQARKVPIDEVSSPTFTLIQEYVGDTLIRHCDTYRLKNADEFADLGLDELFGSDGIAFVEWADRVEEYLPRDRLTVRIAIESPESRTIDVLSSGRRSRQIVSGMASESI